ncbi:conjugal transfer mating-pair stabilization protein TraG [Pectobacterium brasiliense]|uniref:conjugal transfer mating-pair stabilization protein TraG n=1 Tax=Pectobacterium brasiliense TaxID=180957 RepID=UPI001968D5D8|nr:conjugal transfer mating-pair stabilization protein TraG [Pectobacterium brasiliense]MBN3262946.1 conjugal transfer mating pair stabilization protein TraG [Pectobacterium brasiliense]
MLEVYTIYGGEMWSQAFNAVVTILGTSTWATLLRIVGTFSVLAVLIAFVKTRNPLVFIQWLAVFMLVTSVLLVPKRSVQVIDITDRAAVYKVDNVPVGLAGTSSLTSSIGFHLAEIFDYVMSRPDSITYTKSGMLFGSQIVAETSDFRTQNPELAQMLPDYVENCVIGDILLNHKYTVNQLLNSLDPLSLITDNPSPLRGIYKTTGSSRQFITCMEAATQIRQLANVDSQVGGKTFQWLSGKIFGNRIDATTLLMQSMGESYGYFYSGGLSASQIMKNNITNGAIRQGIKGFAARSSDTANLVNLATESSATKQRLSWAAGNTLATRTLPFMQSLLMLILVCVFPLVIALAAANHTLFGLTTLKNYVGGFLYFQMWPIMFAILNFASTFWLQTKTGSTPLVLANMDQVALQHSDVANLAGYLALSIPVLSFYLTKGAATVGSQVAGNVFSSMAFSSAGQSSTTADGNWSFNNMSMDNLNQNKMDTNLVQRQGQQTFQADNGSTRTVTAGGMNVIDSSGAISNLPVSMKLSQLASSGFQEQARISEAKATSALEGYNDSVTSSWSQLSQLSKQVGSSDSLSQSSDNSQAVNASRGSSMMMSAAESYAKANNVSTQQAYNELMDISNQGSAATGVRGVVGGGFNIGVVKATGEVYGNGELRHSTGSSRGTQDSESNSTDARHDKNSQSINDFRQGLDMVTSSRVSDSSNHTKNAATSDVDQLAATLNEAQSKYHQYTESSTHSNEYSKMATLAQNQSASLDTNYNQEFVNWAANKYGDKSQQILTSAPSAREAAMDFVEEHIKPEIMAGYGQAKESLNGSNSYNSFSKISDTNITSSDGPVDNSQGRSYSLVSGDSVNGAEHTTNLPNEEQTSSYSNKSVTQGSGTRHQAENGLSTEQTSSLSHGARSSVVLGGVLGDAGRTVVTGTEGQSPAHVSNSVTQRSGARHQAESGLSTELTSSLSHGGGTSVASGGVLSEAGRSVVTGIEGQNPAHGSNSVTQRSGAGAGQQVESGLLAEQTSSLSHGGSSVVSGGVLAGAGRSVVTGTEGQSPAPVSNSVTQRSGAGLQTSVEHSSSLSHGGIVEKKPAIDLHESFNSRVGNLRANNENELNAENIKAQVAAQRSSLEAGLENSSEQITKKETNIRSNSDILKGEMSVAQGKFEIGRTEADIDQTTPVIEGDKKEDLQRKLEELRKKTE